MLDYSFFVEGTTVLFKHVKHGLIPLSLCAFVLTAPLSFTAAADEYQVEATLALADNNAYSSSYTGTFKYYFYPVDDSVGPKALAPLLNRSSYVQASTELTTFPESDNRIENLNDSLSARVFLDSGIFLGAHVDFFSTNYRTNALAFSQDTLGYRLGYASKNNSYISVYTSYTESDYPHFGTFEDVDLDVGKLIQLGDNRYISLDGQISRFINNNVEYNGDSVKLGISYYHNDDLGIYITNQTVDFDQADDRLITNLGIDYHFNSLFSTRLDTQIWNEKTDRINRQTLTFKMRF